MPSISACPSCRVIEPAADTGHPNHHIRHHQQRQQRQQQQQQQRLAKLRRRQSCSNKSIEHSAHDTLASQKHGGDTLMLLDTALYRVTREVMPLTH